MWGDFKGIHKPMPRRNVCLAGPSPQATVEHRSAAHALAVTLSGKRWEVAHDFGKKVATAGLQLWGGHTT